MITASLGHLLPIGTERWREPTSFQFRGKTILVYMLHHVQSHVCVLLLECPVPFSIWKTRPHACHTAGSGMEINSQWTLHIGARQRGIHSGGEPVFRTVTEGGTEWGFPTLSRGNKALENSSKK